MVIMMVHSAAPRKYFIKLSADGNEPFFVDRALVGDLLRILRDQSEASDFFVWAYCFMPDHLQLLIEGRWRGADMSRFLSSFKRRSNLLYRQLCRRRLWQEDWRKLALKEADPILSVARFIFDSPVRRGLVCRFTDYDLLGSFELNVKYLLMQGPAASPAAVPVHDRHAVHRRVMNAHTTAV